VVGVFFLGRDGAPFTKDDEELLGDVAGLLAPFLKDRKKLEREEQLRRRAEQKIEASLREKEVLLREIHHRVKNNLQVIVSLLGMTAHRSENPEALAVLEESRSRVYSMALVHQTLYSSNTLSYVDMNRYIPRLVQAIQAALCNPSRISVTGKSSDVEVDLDQAVPLGLIINELVSNAIKHGFPGGREGLVVVELVEQEQNLLLTVRDNGVGLNPGESYETEHSLGLHLVRAMAEQLGGILATRSQGGTVVELQFPRTPAPRPREPGE
jgi:two-component sensor histidine kinase